MLFTWKKTLLFVAGTTLVLLVLNWLILSDILPIKKTIDYSAVQANFIQFWIKLAAFIGLLLPVIALFVWWRYLGYSREVESRGMLPFHPSLPKPCVRLFTAHGYSMCNPFVINRLLTAVSSSLFIVAMSM